MSSESDVAFMRRAIELSRNGFPAPNPHVGCVIASGERIVGEGYHHHAGGPHAEIVALSQAGEAAKGADVFVTLEPCDHFGRTPPCSRALISAGVKRVVVAVRDLSSRAGGGAETLESAGIRVETGLLTAEAESANRLFLFALQHLRPYVIAKAASSLDGRIALPSGESRWITGHEARLRSHRLRAECGAVLVGRNTVELDDPRLTSRLDGVVNQPLRVVLDPGAKLNGRYKVFSDEAETWHVTGVIDLPNLLERLRSAGHIGLMVEGGGITIGGFLKEDLVDEIRLFLAPKVLGDGPSWASGIGLQRLSQAAQFRLVDQTMLGTDLELNLIRIRENLIDS